MAKLVSKGFKDFTGGVNLRDAPVGLQDPELIASENMEPAQGGLWLQGRNGQSAYGGNNTAIDSNPIRSIYRFYKSNGTGLLLATSGTKAYKGDDALGTVSDISSATVTYTADKKFSLVTWSAKDKVYLTNDVEAIHTYNGTTFAALGGSPPVCKMLELYNDRLYALQNNGVRFTDLNVDNVWPGTNLLNISDSRGGIGTFIKATGTVLVIGKDSGLMRFEGSPILGGQLKQYSNVGCLAGWTADATPWGVIFLGQDGVYLTDGFEAPTRISPRISNVFSGIFRTAVGKYYPAKKQYWLSFNTSGGAADTLWIATFIEREGEQLVAWHKQTGFNVESMATWDGGSDSGQIYIGMSTTGKVRRADFGSTDQGTNYACKVQLRHEDFSTDRTSYAGVNKQLRWIKAVFEASSVVNYAVEYSFGKATGGGGSISAEQQTNALFWDVGNWDEKNWGAQLVSNKRTSVLDMKAGKYLSVAFQNTGDGSAFKFYSVELEARVKDQRAYEPFALAATA